MWDAGGAAVVSHHGVDQAPAHSVSRSREEERRFHRVVNETRSSFVKVKSYCSSRFSWNRKESVFLAFAVSDPQSPRLEIHIGDVESNAFRETDGCAVEGLEDGTVSDTERRSGRRFLQ